MHYKISSEVGTLIVEPKGRVTHKRLSDGISSQHTCVSNCVTIIAANGLYPP